MSLVVHFQGKTFSPEWKFTGSCLYSSLLIHQKNHKQDVEGRVNSQGNLIWEGGKEYPIGKIGHPIVFSQ
jgi:hypothetical protein